MIVIVWKPVKMDWTQEAQAVIKDIQKDVKEIAVSDKWPMDDTGVHLNLTTLDGDRFCVKMTCAGFEIVAKEYDKATSEDIEPIIYETPYAMLSAISKMYTDSFANRLCAAMMKIAE